LPPKKGLHGTLPDADVGRRTGRSENAVRIKREALGLPLSGLRAWSAAELAQLGTATDARVADGIGRTTSAVAQKRWKLGLPSAGKTAGSKRQENSAGQRPKAIDCGARGQARRSPTCWSKGEATKVGLSYSWSASPAMLVVLR